MLRKLESSQHGQTKKLWEAVFWEDTKVFIDYYYFLKTRDNQIYVIEEDSDIRSMLHLNPYLLQIAEERHACNYIVAVATEEAYRKRGYMGQLLRKAMADMYETKEPFTFLTPAAEAIYTPYDFRFVYDQKRGAVHGQSGTRQAETVEAGLGDGGGMAEFFMNQIAPRYQVCAVRDEQYYQTMIFEQQSENGGVKLIKSAGEIVGMYAYARDIEKIEVREPVYREEWSEEFRHSLYELSNQGHTPITVFGADQTNPDEKVPYMMVRILNLNVLLNLLHVKEGAEIQCSFAVLDSILTKNSKVWRLRSTGDDTEILADETEDSEGVLTIGALTSFLFGYKTLEEIGNEPDVFLSERLKGELDKINRLEPVYLNEVV